MKHRNKVGQSEPSPCPLLGSFVPAGVAGKTSKALFKTLDDPSRDLMDAHFNYVYNSGATVFSYYYSNSKSSGSGKSSSYPRGAANRKGTNSRAFNAPPIGGCLLEHYSNW